MKKILVSVLFLSFIAFSLHAKGPKPLDPSTITNPVPVTQITILVTSDVDTENQGKNFMMNIFPGYLEMITKIITEQSNIKIDPSEYLSQIASSTIDIKFEKIDFGGKMKFHQYSWESIEKKSPRTSLVLGFVIRDDQTMPLTVTIREDDPKNKYGNVLTLEIPLKVVTKETE